MNYDNLLIEIKALKKLRKLVLSVNYEATNLRDRLPEIDRSIEIIIIQLYQAKVFMQKFILGIIILINIGL